MTTQLLAVPSSGFDFGRETLITWRYIRHNFSATVIPGSLFTLASVISAGKAGIPALLAVLSSLLFFFFYVYAFDTNAQSGDMETEDTMNKPDRPLPAGLVTREGALFRSRVGVLGLLGIGLAFGVSLWSVVWIISAGIYLFAPIGKHWAWKNANIAIGTFAMLMAAWSIGGGDPAFGLSWSFWTALICYPLISIQDFRDVEGDRAIGRNTLPMAIGDRACRVLMVFCYALAPIYIHFTMFAPFGMNQARWAAEIPPTVVLLFIAAWMPFARSPRAMHRIYMFMPIWYIFHLTAAIIFAATSR